MLLDALLLMEDDESAVTTSCASTDYIDTLAAGNAYVGDWFVVKVGATAFTAKNGAPTTAFRLESDSNTGFTDGITLCQSSGFLVAAMTASTILYKCRIPAGARRYLRAYKHITNYAAGTIDISAGSWQAFIVKDTDLNEIPGS